MVCGHGNKWRQVYGLHETLFEGMETNWIDEVPYTLPRLADAEPDAECVSRMCYDF